MRLKTIVFAAALSLPSLVHAQFDFKVDGRDIQVHSFAQRGFAFSNTNNFLTMKTSDGSFAMTDTPGEISPSV